MSNAVFPTLPGLTWGSTKEPMWTTHAKRSASGMEQRAGYMSYPIYRIKLSYEFLRAGAEAELQTLIGFFNQRGGDLESFLFDDPIDNAAVDQQFGVGDGTTTVFRLGRTLGGAYEPVSATYGTPNVQGNNLLKRSQQFEQSPWSQYVNSDVDVSPDVATAPDGTNTAEKLYEATTANSIHEVTQQFTATDNTVYTASAFFKSAERTQVLISLFAKDGTFKSARFDLSTGAVIANIGGATGAIQDVGNGWYRCSCTANIGAGASTPYVVLQINNAGTDAYVGTIGSGVYLWGAQCEAGTIATPYMKTTALASSVALDVNTAIATYTPAPAAGTPLLWSGRFYKRVRFEKSSLEFKEFLRELWEAKTLSMLTVKT
jgi:hypothetical protein